jgi:hypothetical protein
MAFLPEMRNTINLSSHQSVTAVHHRYFGQNLDGMKRLTATDVVA